MKANEEINNDGQQRVEIVSIIITKSNETERIRYKFNPRNLQTKGEKTVYSPQSREKEGN